MMSECLAGLRGLHTAPTPVEQQDCARRFHVP